MEGVYVEVTEETAIVEGSFGVMLVQSRWTARMDEYPFHLESLEVA